MPAWRKQTATNTPRTLTGSGGSAADFRRASSALGETVDALSRLCALFDAVAIAIETDDEEGAVSALRNLPAAYVNAAREVDAMATHVAPLAGVLRTLEPALAERLV
jgi:hypothetical protein